MGRGTLPEVRDESGDPPEGTGRVGRPSRRFGTGEGTLSKVRYESRDPWECSGRVGRPTGKSGTGRGTLSEIRDKLATLGDVRDG